MVQKIFISFLYVLYALYGLNKLICPSLCPLCLCCSNKLYVLFCVLCAFVVQRNLISYIVQNSVLNLFLNFTVQKTASNKCRNPI